MENEIRIYETEDKKMTNVQRIELDEVKGLLNVISQYSYALKILDDYDHQTSSNRKRNSRRSL